MRTYWSSRFGFIMATTGAAVGLGNIWKFPYMAGSGGGSAFVGLYLIFLLLLGLPCLLAELLLGRLGAGSMFRGLKNLCQAHQCAPIWQALAAWGALGLLLVLSFYSVVAGWSLAYFFYACQNQLQGDALSLQSLWQNLLDRPQTMLICHTLFIIMTLLVVSAGVQKGIERLSKFLMPLLFMMLICLCVYAFLYGDARHAWQFLSHFDAQALNRGVVMQALGHAFFTLAIGAGCMLTYGSYLKPQAPFVYASCLTAGLDLCVALLSGMAIFPLVFAHHLTPEAGPGLMFRVLPLTFHQMPAGQWIAGVFFLLLVFAAWNSTLSMAEPLVAALIDRFNFTRRKASLFIALLSWIGGLLALLSFNHLAHWQLFARNLFTLMSDSVTNVILPLGCLGFTLFTAWVLPKRVLAQAWGSEKGFTLWYFLVRYIAPLGITSVFAVHWF